MIYKMFDGRHIDLDRILDVSPAYFDDRMGHGGWFVGFTIQFQLRDGAINYIYPVERFIELHRDWSSLHRQFGWTERNVKEPATRELQFHVDAIIKAWINNKEHHNARIPE